MVGTWSDCDVMMPMTMMVGCVRMCRKLISYPCQKVTMIDKYKVRSVFDNVFSLPLSPHTQRIDEMPVVSDRQCLFSVSFNQFQ